MKELIRIKIFPGTKKERIEIVTDDKFDIYVKEKPEQGRANTRMIELLARHFGISDKKFKIIKGSKTRNKIVKILN